MNDAGRVSSQRARSAERRVAQILALVLSLSISAIAGAQLCATDVQRRLPVSVVYGEGAAGRSARDIVIFTPEDDGTVRATDGANGTTLWAFRPPELQGAVLPTGLITELRVLRFDANGDGVIDAADGDKVWLYFGLRRGGPFYYALDATDRVSATVLWKAGPGQLPFLGYGWSPPTLARVRIADAAQNGEHFVLILGGGLDEDAMARPSEGAEGAAWVVGAGNRLLMLDAATGELLWSAGGPSSRTNDIDSGAHPVAGPPDLLLPAMQDSMPARVTALDTNGDHYADRMYAADIAGRIWRFDISNNHRASALVSGGIFALLGADAEPGASALRFFNAPDVALVHPQGAAPFHHLAVGSGDARTPRETSSRDRFFSLRDYAPSTPLDQPAYDAMAPLLPTQLVDVTSAPGAPLPPDARGWRIDLAAPEGHAGEKVLAEAVTADGVVLFTTYQPPQPPHTEDCLAAGTNRVYALQVHTASAVLDVNRDSELTEEDRSMELMVEGIAAEAIVRLRDPAAVRNPPNGAPGFPGDPGLPGDPSDPASPRGSPPAGCHVGEERLEACPATRVLRRTFWQRRGIN